MVSGCKFDAQTGKSGVQNGGQNEGALLASCLELSCPRMSTIPLKASRGK